MSLQVDDSGRRGRSRSPSGRRADKDRGRSRTHAGMPYPSSTDAFADPSSTAYQYERLSGWPTDADDTSDYYPAAPRGSRPPDDRDDPFAEARRSAQYIPQSDWEPDHGRDPDREKNRERDRERDRPRPDLYLPGKYAASVKTAETLESPRQSRDSLRGKDRDGDREGDRDSDKDRDRRRKKEKLEADLAYGKMPGPSKHDRPESPPPAAAAASYGYAQPNQYEYAGPEEPRYSATYLDPHGSAAPRPGRRSPSPGPPSPLKSAMKRDRSPQPPTARMSMLTVQTPHHSGSLSVSSAPASPLLEAYHGTYQSMSPMPSPMLLPTASSSNPQVLEALSPIGSDDERAGDRRRARRARFNDPADDAARLAKALKGERRAPDTEPLIEILPGLTHEQVMELRAEYKRLVKTGAERKGVNLAKHIRARLKDEDPNLMKACYATALGRWESEAYWANFWYHGDKTRRELLIEALMGRTNEEIRLIKAGFSDKKYGDSLVRCMRTELKEDKFKKAVLMVLEEQRMDEVDAHGRPARIDYDLVDDDVRQLRRAVQSDRGGESLMLSVVTQRSDAHLAEVLREYRAKYKANFAKDALRKSGNLVGEVLAHVLNGVINRPLRDAMLLHHALTASRRDDLRRELLTSRLVRCHWDAAHMARVRRAFRDHHGRDLPDAVRDAVPGEWGDFLRALCIVRMPDEVRRVERVDIHR